MIIAAASSGRSVRGGRGRPFSVRADVRSRRRYIAVARHVVHDGRAHIGITLIH
jgi:hypothetical protein